MVQMKALSDLCKRKTLHQFITDIATIQTSSARPLREPICM
jgi:hypothetical protein